MIPAAKLLRSRVVTITALLLISGCGPILETDYGTVRGKSINGIGTFVDLLRQSDRKVDVWPAISPRMKHNYQTLIVLHSDYDRFPAKLTRQVQELMEQGSIRTLIVIARDSDGAVDYWRQIRNRSELSTEQITDASESFDERVSSFNSQAKAEFESEAGVWYGMKAINRSPDTQTTMVDCDSNEGSFSVEARWPLNRRLVPTETATILWKSNEEPLLTFEQTAQKKILVLASAAPILNGGLVDPGNRQLAADLAKRIPETDRVAISVSSFWIDGTKMESPSLIRFVKVFPNGWVFGQGTLVLLLFCWWKFPIFGRPRQSVDTETARFGRHVSALGDLLARTRNLEFARKRIEDWQEVEKTRSGSESLSN